MIDLISIIIGLAGGILIVILYVFLFKRKKKPSLEKLKQSTKESYEHLESAAKIQRELYKLFNELE